MDSRLVVAYREGRQAYPHSLHNPYQGDWTAARMWRLGWHRARDEATGTPNPPTTELDRLDEGQL